MKIVNKSVKTVELRTLYAGMVFLHDDRFFMVSDETANESDDILVICLSDGIIQRYDPEMPVVPKHDVELVVS